MSLSAGQKMLESCACRKKSGQAGQAMASAALIVLDVGNSSNEKGSAWEAAARHVCRPT